MLRTPGGNAHRFPPHFRRLCALALIVLACGGCTRRYWRDQADGQVFGLWNGFTAEAGQPSREQTIGIRPQSRMFDPTNPDHPPMAPDDPVAHSRMHCVDGMRGYRKWHKYGSVSAVDDEHWRAYLPYDEQGHVLLDRNSAVQISLMNSRDYQRELEDLYLSALDVTFERFRFSSQFFFTNDTLFTTVGPRRPGNAGASSILANDSNFQVDKLYAGGGQLVADLANSIVWQFAGADTNANVSIASFNFMQPLLRFGGRARVLERLTLSERSLIYNVRQMEQYRQGFYAQVITGRSPGDGPAQRGLGSGVGNPIPSFTGVGGYFGLLQSQQIIKNQEANVATLRDSLTRLQEEFDANRLKDKFQVELARQALYRGQSTLLSTKANFQTSLDSFKLLMGIAPDVELKVDDPMLKQFQLIDPEVTRLTELAGRLALKTHRNDEPITDVDLAALVGAEDGMRKRIEEHLVSLEADYETLLEAMPAREAQLTTLLNRPEVVRGEVERGAYSVDALRNRVKSLRVDIDGLKKGFTDTWAAIEQIRIDLKTGDQAAIRERLKRTYPELSSQLLALTLAKARARVDAVVWVPIEISSADALETARINRRDWANARAQLVDIWRLIEFNANALKSGLNVTLAGDVQTRGDNPINFTGSTGRLVAGLQFDAPLTRLIERNTYRGVLIDYQRNRRAYMQFEDRVSQNLRLILRTLELNQLNFEVRRSAIQVAIQQVDLARENLNRPPRINETAEAYAVARASIGRDLVSALSDLLDTQNEFLNVWVTYEVQRLNLDFEMGTMMLDDQGMWIDPGPIRVDPNAAVDDRLMGDQDPDEADAPLPLPREVFPEIRIEGVPVPQPPDALPPPDARVPGPVMKPVRPLAPMPK